MSIYEKHGNVLLKKLSQYEQTDTIEMHKLMSLYALDVIVGELKAYSKYLSYI